MKRSRDKGLLIAEPRQIRALASPIRQDILDTVTAIGPCSVADVARALDRPADGLYYHVRLLVRVRLLKATNGSERADRGELRLDVPRKAMYLRYDPADPRNRTAILRVITAQLRSAERTFRRGFHPGLAVVDGPRRNLWAGRARGALSPRDLEEANRLLGRLTRLMRAGRSDTRHRRGEKRVFHEISFVFAPVSPRS